MISNPIEYLKQLLKTGDYRKFYRIRAWRMLRKQVLSDDHNECQSCKAKGMYTKADTVHHVKYVHKHPDLTLSKHYIDDDGKKQRQLVSLCHRCHDLHHKHGNKPKKPVTIERW